MGTHPIFESDFDCLTEMFVTRAASKGAWNNIKAMAAPAIRYGKGVMDAKADDGGSVPRIRGPLSRLLRDSYIRHGDFVGEDAHGNKYYINHDYPIPRNRWVVFSEKTFEQKWDFDASDVPAEWHRWLTYMTDDPPTEAGVMPVERKFITEHVRNVTGTVEQYVPYTTTRKKVEAWDPDN